MYAFSPFAIAPMAPQGLGILPEMPRTPELHQNSAFHTPPGEPDNGSPIGNLPPLIFYVQLPRSSMTTVLLIDPETADLAQLQRRVRMDWGIHPDVPLLLVHTRYNQPRLHHPNPTFTPVALLSQESLEMWLHDLASPTDRHILEDAQARFLIAFPNYHFHHPNGLAIPNLGEVANTLQAWSGVAPPLYPRADTQARHFFDQHVQQQMARIAIRTQNLLNAEPDAHSEDAPFEDAQSEREVVQPQEAAVGPVQSQEAATAEQTPEWLARQLSIQNFFEEEQRVWREIRDHRRQDEEDMRREELEYVRQVEALRQQRAAIPLVERPQSQTPEAEARVLRTGQWQLQHQDPSSFVPHDLPAEAVEQSPRGRTSRRMQPGGLFGAHHTSEPMIRSLATVPVPEPVLRLRPSPRQPPTSLSLLPPGTPPLLPPVATAPADGRPPPHNIPVPLQDLLESPPTSESLFSALGSDDNQPAASIDGQAESPDAQAESHDAQAEEGVEDIVEEIVEVPIVLAHQAPSQPTTGWQAEWPRPSPATTLGNASLLPSGFARHSLGDAFLGTRSTMAGSSTLSTPSKSRLTSFSITSSPSRWAVHNLHNLRRASASAGPCRPHAEPSSSARRPSAPNLGQLNLRRVSSCALMMASNFSSLTVSTGHELTI